MSFCSLRFFIFFGVFFILYWLLPHKYRKASLLVFSYIFYAFCGIGYLLLLFASSSFTYIIGILIEKTKDKKKIFLNIYLVCILLILFIFKYLGFVFGNIVLLAGIVNIHMDPIMISLVLPVGISFYTFQSISYVVDVYRGTINAEKDYCLFLVFISYFPQILSGPINRARELLPQLKRENVFCYSSAAEGLILFGWGLFKKCVIADRISEYVNTIYASVQNYKGFTFVLIILFYTFQIYCDFSGYSDMACGISEMLGIKMAENFHSPYLSTSIKEFWSRWHISLSSWLRDYIYIPLGGNRRGKFRSKINLIITFLISGLWHGAAWNFVVWGALHGVGQCIEKVVTQKKNKKKTSVLGWMLVFVFVSLTWVFFRAESISDAVYVITHSISGITDPVHYFISGVSSLSIPKFDIICLIVSFGILIPVDVFSLKTDVIGWIRERKEGVRWAIYVLFILSIIFMCPIAVSSEFIYFQF